MVQGGRFEGSSEPIAERRLAFGLPAERPIDVSQVQIGESEGSIHADRVAIRDFGRVGDPTLGVEISNVGVSLCSVRVHQLCIYVLLEDFAE